MQFDSYRWQDHVQTRYRRSIDLALTLAFLFLLGAGAVLQSSDRLGRALAQDGPEIRTAAAERLHCDA